ncbi:MAG: hypothetical protein LBE38_03560, partial [Deltaproteobacteria bacterium]|nr:hypothetical protein [Deltaproteobacteria bacterium]
LLIILHSCKCPKLILNFFESSSPGLCIGLKLSFFEYNLKVNIHIVYLHLFQKIKPCILKTVKSLNYGQGGQKGKFKITSILVFTSNQGEKKFNGLAYKNFSDFF